MKKKIYGIFKNQKLVKQITILLLISIGFAYFIKIMLDYRAEMEMLLYNKSEYYLGLATYIEDSMEEYNNMPWLFRYWYTHSDEMDIIYDDKDATKRKHEKFHELHPEYDIHLITEEELMGLSEESQKLYAEAEYMDWIDKFNSIKKAYGPTFLSCACLMEDGYTRFYYISGADEGQTRGNGKTDVYILGSTFESNSNAQSLWDMAWNNQNLQSEFKDLGSGYYHIYTPYIYEGKPVCVIDVTVKIDEAKKRLLRELIHMEAYAVIPFIICAVLLVTFLKIFIIYPINVLSGTMKNYQEDKNLNAVKSDLDCLHGKNEMGVLSESFVNMVTDISEYIDQIASLSREKEKISQQKLTEMEQITTQIMNAFVAAVEAKDRYTGGHSKRVAEYSKKIAEKLSKSPEEEFKIYCAALLHDVGKIGIPEEIINCPTKLTPEQYDEIKKHPETGNHILSIITKIPYISLGAKHHHERFDGNGYPNRLSRYEIPEIARIIAVADAYDAMTSTRSYRQIMSQKEARQEILNGRGKQFDPTIADVMLEIIDEDVNYELHG